MRNLWYLYTAELRKILMKKAAWIGMAVGILFILLVGLANLSADGHSVYVQRQEAILKELSGEKMDEAFFQSFTDEINTYIEQHPETFAKIEAYDPGACFQNGAAAAGKSALYDQIYNVVRDRDQVGKVTASGFYDSMREDILKDARELGCSEEEIDTWMKTFDQIEQPMEYSYALAYLNILDVLFLVGWVLILNVAIALSGVFADEKTNRTDAMILSTRNGRLPICGAKILAGSSVAVMEALVLIGICFGVMTAFYGTTGWNAAIQNVIPTSPWHITIGTMILIYIGFAVVTAILFSLSNLLLSHVTGSALVTMAVHAAVIFAGLFNMPGKMGLLAKLWQLRPTMPLYYGTFCNLFRYGPFNNVEISFLLYIGMSLIMLAVLIVLYSRAQVESR